MERVVLLKTIEMREWSILSFEITSVPKQNHASIIYGISHSVIRSGLHDVSGVGPAHVFN
jgi:hypothetical protein